MCYNTSTQNQWTPLEAKIISLSNYQTVRILLNIIFPVFNLVLKIYVYLLLSINDLQCYDLSTMMYAQKHTKYSITNHFSKQASNKVVKKKPVKDSTNMAIGSRVTRKDEGLYHFTYLLNNGKLVIGQYQNMLSGRTCYGKFFNLSKIISLLPYFSHKQYWTWKRRWSWDYIIYQSNYKVNFC
jgi:hypothetical protein